MKRRTEKLVPVTRNRVTIMVPRSRARLGQIFADADEDTYAILSAALYAIISLDEWQNDDIRSSAILSRVAASHPGLLDRAARCYSGAA